MSLASGAVCSLAEFADSFCLTSLQPYAAVSVSLILFILAFKSLISASKSLLVGLERLCSAYNIAEDVAGATILAFGGSVPELLVNFIATSREEADLGASAIVGSGLIAYLLIPGVIIGFTETRLTIHRSSVLRDSLVYLVALVLVCACSAHVSLYLSSSLVLIYAGYLFYLLRHSHGEDGGQKNKKLDSRELVPLLEKTNGGAAGAGKTVVAGFMEIAVTSFVLSNVINYWTTLSGLKEGFLALVLVSLGAEIPDGVNAYTAATRGHGAMAMSACLGAQVVNICLGLGLPWLVHGLLGRGSQPQIDLNQSFSRAAEKVLLGVVVCAVLAVSLLINRDQSHGDPTVSRGLGYMLVATYVVCVVTLGVSCAS